MVPYHDQEWGVPVHDDRTHFELITLEGAQAGLSWLTVLKRRDGYRKAFANFDPDRVAKFDQPTVEALMIDPGIIRHRQKIESTISNALAFQAVQKEQGSFDNFISEIVGTRPQVNKWKSTADLPASTAVSDRLSKELKRRGFRFVGSTICYSYLQATGVVNDHVITCFRHEELSRA